MYDNTSHNLGHGIVQDHFGVHGFEKIMFCQFDGPTKVTRAQTALAVAQRLVQHRLFFTPKEEVWGIPRRLPQLQHMGSYCETSNCVFFFGMFF